MAAWHESPLSWRTPPRFDIAVEPALDIVDESSLVGWVESTNALPLATELAPAVTFSSLWAIKTASAGSESIAVLLPCLFEFFVQLWKDIKRWKCIT